METVGLGLCFEDLPGKQIGRLAPHTRAVAASALKARGPDRRLPQVPAPVRSYTLAESRGLFCRHSGR
jgi:hypothetical protein